MRHILGALALLAAFSTPAIAQNVPSDILQGPDLAGRSVQLIALITILSIVPGIAVMVTCFPFLVTVLSILRQALGLQTAPPNMVIVSLAMFLTWFIMDPVLTEAWEDGAGPFSRGEIELAEAIPITIEPFRIFMAGRVDPDTYQQMQALTGC